MQRRDFLRTAAMAILGAGALKWAGTDLWKPPEFKPISYTITQGPGVFNTRAFVGDRTAGPDWLSQAIAEEIAREEDERFLQIVEEIINGKTMAL